MSKELDEEIAKKVFGLDLEKDMHTPPIGPPFLQGFGLYCGVPPFSTYIAAAWTVVEKLDRHFELERDNAPVGSSTGVNWVATFALGHWAEAETAPEAICRAALKTVEAE